MNKKYQFYGTPEWLADYMCSFIIDFSSILEPSAGDGALIKSIRKLSNNKIDCFEAMPENRAILSTMDNIALLGDDFLKNELKHNYMTIIASPPFSDGADIEHIKMMYSLLETGGRLITTCSSKISDKKKEFLEWIKTLNCYVEELTPDAFQESGSTNKGSYLLIFNK